MPLRAISSATISFGLVSIPVKLFTAASSEQVRFNWIHKESGSRVKQQFYNPTNNEVVPRSDLVKGYEYGKGQYVLFEEEELKKLEAERSNSLEIVEFVPLSTVDFVQVEKSYYLGPDKGGDKAYRLLSEAMKRTERVAVGRWAARGKEQLVLVRPYRDGLILHQMYYANEVRDFGELDTGAKVDFKDVEMDLAEKLIEQLSSEKFDPEQYEDAYANRVREAVDQKVAGQEVQIIAEQPKAQIIDLFEALKKSLSDAGDSGGADAAAAGESPKGEVKPKPVKKTTARRQTKKKTG